MPRDRHASVHGDHHDEDYQHYQDYQADGDLHDDGQGAAHAVWRELADALAVAVRAEDVLDVLARLAPRAWGAGMVNISLLDAERQVLQLVRSVHTPDEVEEAFATYSATGPFPSTDALQTGRPVLLASLQERDARYPAFARIELDQQSFAVLPLVHQGEPLGILGLGWPHQQQFTAAFVAELERVARVCAGAVVRCRQYDEQRAGRDAAEEAAARLRTLYVLSTALAETTTAADVAVTVVATCMPTLNATAALVSELDERGDVHVLAHVGLAWADMPWEELELAGQALAEPPLIRQVLQTRQPILIESCAGPDQRSPHTPAGQVRQQAWANLPLLVGDRLRGMVAFGWDQPRQFTTADREFYAGIAHHLALALDRARLLEGTRSVAETLQRALLPRHVPSVPGWDLATYYRPALDDSQVGGDWHDSFLLPDDRLGLVIGDVMGKGVQAASIMGSARAALRALASLEPDPSLVLHRLDHWLTAFDVPGFVTACYLLLDPATGRSELAAAGHPPALHLTRHGQAHWVTALSGSGSGLPLGAINRSSRDDPRAAYPPHDVLLNPGDLLVLYTDGLVEHRTHDLDVGLTELSQRSRHLLNATDLAAAVTHLVAKMSHTDHADDVAVVALRRWDSSPEPSGGRA